MGAQIKKFIFILIITFLVSPSCQAKPNETVLDKSWEEYRRDTILAMMERNYSLAEKHAQLMIRASKNLGENNLIIESYWRLANAYMDMGNYQKAEENYKQSILLAKQAGYNRTATGKMFFLAELYFQQNKLSQAESTYKSALDYYDEKDQSIGRHHIDLDLLRGLFQIYQKEGKTTEAERISQIYKEMASKYRVD